MLEPTEQRHAEETFANWLPSLLPKEQATGTGADKTVVSVLTVTMREVLELFIKRFPKYSRATGLENKFPGFRNGVPVSEAKWDREKSKVH
jgi:hypothetical protein